MNAKLLQLHACVVGRLQLEVPNWAGLARKIGVCSAVFSSASTTRGLMSDLAHARTVLAGIGVVCAVAARNARAVATIIDGDAGVLVARLTSASGANGRRACSSVSRDTMANGADWHGNTKQVRPGGQSLHSDS